MERKVLRIFSFTLLASTMFSFAACSTQTAKCEHQFTEMKLGATHIATEAVGEFAAEYYYSCSLCGENGTQTFSPQIEDKELYTPSAFTMTMYETSPTLSYGFTWNCKAKPIDPIVEYREVGQEEFSYVSAEVTEVSGYLLDDTQITLYKVQAICTLEVDANYEYRVGDLASGIGTERQTITTVNPKATSFKFATVSDTQSYEIVETIEGYYKESRYLNNAFKAMGAMDFYLHSGDIVETSKYEENWAGMLNDNYEFLSQKPMMVANGNHDTATEIQKHFNNNLADEYEESIFYSFDYGNAKFIVLDTNTKSSGLDMNQYIWLDEILANNQQKWTIVLMHCPMYSVGKWGSDPSRNKQSLSLRSALGDLFAYYEVDLVIQGHDHTVSKTFPIGEEKQVAKETYSQIEGVEYIVNPRGVIYIMNGTGGNGTRSPQATYEKEYYDYLYGSHESSWAEYTVEEDTLTVKVKYYDKKNDKVCDIDSFGILKN